MPVLNEQDNLEPLHARLTTVLKKLDRSYEIIYVDDGSWSTLRRLAAGDAHVGVVRLRRNFCQTAALATVALSGDGGDEVFAGYPTYQAHRVAQVYARVPEAIREGLVRPPVRRLPVSLDNLSPRGRTG